MANVVFVARERNQVEEIKSQLSEKETFGDVVRVVAADDFDALSHDGWIHILDVLPNKTDALILDHSDTHLRLGFVTDIHHEALDDGTERKNAKREPVERLPKECPSCAFLKPAKVHECPACGFKPEKVTDVEAAEGKLDELKRKKKENKEMSPEEKSKFFGELKWFAEKNNYKPGWAAYKYKERFGVWPNAHKSAPPFPASEATVKWLRHLQIKNAKRKSVA